MADRNEIEHSKAGGLFESYQCPKDRFDELFLARSESGTVRDGNVDRIIREHYLPLFSERNPYSIRNVSKSVGDSTPFGGSSVGGKVVASSGVLSGLPGDTTVGLSHEVLNRWQSIKRQLRENPSASTGQLSRTDASRLWELDPIPFVISNSDWENLARGIEQRVRILDGILQDVYGEQRLIADGILPPEIVFGSSGFIRSMKNALPNSNLLNLYACQITRDASGQWQVIADRTQGPSGLGLAVENRLAISNLLEYDFRHMNVRRLAGFFANFREHLKRSPTLEGSSQTINVLLSPGVASPTYFEDAYLARYLGYTLTNVSDLTVRGGQVYLKTLGGLVRVGVILRRISDTESDPLEININGASGVSGLCQAIRDRQVYVANQLGSGWAESPALTSLLPKIAKQRFGEELILKNPSMHWCGDPKSLAFVLDNIDNFAFRNAFTRHSGSDWYMHNASAQEQSKFKELLMSKPWSVVAIEKFAPSYSPTWLNDKLVAKPAVLRLFASKSRDGFDIMPGGIARVADREDRLSESLICGSLSKDVWVLSKEKVPTVSLLSGSGFLTAPGSSSSTITEMRRNVMDLPSRVAEHLYWLGRSTERAEGMARHARLCVSQLAGTVEPDMLAFYWQVVYALAGEDGPLSESLPSDSSRHVEDMRKEVVSFLYSQERAVSLSRALFGIRFNSEVIRDRLSYDSWQLLSKFDLDHLMPWVERRDRLSDAGTFLNQTITMLSAFAGLVSENMTRGPGWLFLELGRRIERAYAITRLIELLLVPGGRPMSGLAESLLEITDSSMTYRYRYLTNYEVAPALDLLLFDPANPRSVAFQLVKITEHLDGLTAAGKVDVTLMRRGVLDTRALLRLYDAQSLATEGKESNDGPPMRVHLIELLTKINNDLNTLGDFLSQRFLNHTVAVRHLEDAANQ